MKSLFRLGPGGRPSRIWRASTRCDAIFLTKDASFTPPSEPVAFPVSPHPTGTLMEIPESKEYDLGCVIGGGYSAWAAISACQGLKVALLQNRAVLGGNGSSEIQVWAMVGRGAASSRLGEIVEESHHREQQPDGEWRVVQGPAQGGSGARGKRTSTFSSTRYRLRQKWSRLLRTHCRVIGADTRSGRNALRGRLDRRHRLRQRGVGLVRSSCSRKTNYMGMSNMWVMKKHPEPVA